MKKQRLNVLIILCSLWLFFLFLVWILSTNWLINGNALILHYSENISFNPILLTSYQRISISTVLIFPFLYSIKILTNKPISIIVRLRTRNYYTLYNIKLCIIFSFLFSFIHELVNSFCLCHFFNPDLIINNNIIALSFLNIISIGLYFFRVSCAYLFLSAFMSSNRSIIIVFLLYLINNVLIKTVFKWIWIPYDDILAIGKIITHSLEYNEIFIILLRCILFSVVMSLLVLLYNSKKDFINYE